MMRLKQLLEAPALSCGQTSILGNLSDATIPRSVECNDLLDRYGFVFAHFDSELLADRIFFFHRADFGRQLLPVAEKFGPGSLGNLKTGLARLYM